MKLVITRRRLTLNLHPGVVLLVLAAVWVGQAFASSSPNRSGLQVARLVAAVIALLLGDGSAAGLLHGG